MSPPAAPDRGQYDYLEGVRGLAAVYVVFYHVWQACVIGSPQSTAVDLALGWAAGGIPAVAVFITLSGFLLNLPVARDGDLKGGVAGFTRRRARRILPPYLAALALSALLALAAGESGGGDGAPTLGENLLSHLTLTHNLRPETVHGLNGPLWSVATECQIYAAFALVLVPLRRSMGPGVALIAGLALGLVGWLAEAAVPPAACLWLAGCFALGAAAAEVAEGRWRRVLARGPWGIVAVVALAGVAWVPLTASRHVHRPELMPVAAGFAALGTCALILAKRRGDGWALAVGRLLSSRGPAWLGAMSYSLYLTHAPILRLVGDPLRAAGVGPAGRGLVLVLVAAPLCGAAARGFYVAFERPTLAPRRAAP